MLIIYHRPSFIPFVIVAVDTNGKDISNSVTLRHYQLDLSPSKSRREISRLVNDCPRGWQFLRSYCEFFGPPSETVSCCRKGRRGQYFRASCAENEICVNHVVHFPSYGITDKPYCVSHNNFVNIAISQLQDHEDADSSSLHLPPTNDDAYSLAAVLVTTNGGLLVNSSSITIKEQKTELIHNVPMVPTLPGGIEKCRDCSRIGIPSIIQGTQKILFTIPLPFNVASAVLLVTSLIG